MSEPSHLPPALRFLEGGSVEAAPRLLGCTLERELGGEIIRARIVEVEAYDQADEASHSFRGETARTRAMFGPSGHLYVYFTYGMHYCANIVTSGRGHGAGVLIRAVEPLEGIETIRRLRGGKTGTVVTSGPGKTAQALGIDLSLSGHDLTAAPLRLLPGTLAPNEAVTQTIRVGISKAVEAPWRFYITGNPYVSKARTDNGVR